MSDNLPTEAQCRAGRVISQSLADHPDSGVPSPWCDCPCYVERETRAGFVLGVYCVRKGQQPPVPPR